MQLGFLDPPAPISPLPVNTDPWKQYAGVALYLGDCIAIMAAMPADSVDAGVTDPPYGIGFMGKEWDTFSPAKTEADARRKLRREFRQDHSGARYDQYQQNPNRYFIAQ